MTRLLRTMLLAVSALLASGADAAFPDDEQPAELVESPLVLPAPPSTNQLLRYEVSPTATMEFAVDARSVSVTDRVVVRFTSVISSPGGAVNVSHEGIRCDTFEKKLYSTGRSDGKWTPASNDSWRPIRNVGANSYHAALATDYFCNGGAAAGTAEAIVERLRRKKPQPRPGQIQ